MIGSKEDSPVIPPTSPSPASILRDDFDNIRSLFNELTEVALDFLNTSNAPVVNTAATRPTLVPNAPDRGIGARAALGDYWQRFRDSHSRSTGPRYFGFVTGGATPASVVADWLVAVLDQNVATERHSVAAFIELQALTYVADLVGLPPKTFHGLLTTGATAANLVCIATAREWCGENAGHCIARDGLASAGSIDIIGCAPHSSVVKVLGILGLGQDRMHRVQAQAGREAIDLALLAQALKARQSSAKIVIASAGTVDTGDFDDLRSVAALCREHGAWLHVDAAFGGFARMSPRLAAWADGLELADSITLDAHKWLNVPYDCGIALTRHPALQERAFSAYAPYIPMDSDLPAYMNRGIEQSRRYRALPLYLSLVAYGRDGYRELIERNCGFALRLSTWIDNHPFFRRLAETRLNIVLFCVEARTAEARALHTKALVEIINGSGVAFLTPTTCLGTFAVRLAVSNWSTTDADFDILTEALHSCVMRLKDADAAYPVT